ncbi:oxidoreductase [Aspergillus arachidicola]|uniref:Oxidoreductase n=1 Tax=Aspergillus arachidicola TaxID=656916 RepID=A0A2G7FQJ1_9EURO|nr:oxidoreductase [Aspergillus arachidicola]
MPIPLLAQGFQEGISSIPYAWTVLKIVPFVLLVAALKYYFGGARNGSERLMHSKVVMVTGGTSGIGASVVHELASRGAQVILLTQHAPSDVFLVDYIEDLRKSTKNQLIYAEQVDLSSLHSIRTFATKWIDNVPPRRLDMVILCGNTAAPSSASRKLTADGLDEEWQVNYLANFHLLSILSPALRAQPPHRDVRVIFTTCSSYIGAKIDPKQIEAACTPDAPAPRGAKNSKNVKKAGAGSKKSKPSLFGASKLAMMSFAQSFQKHLNAYERPDKMPPCTRSHPGYSSLVDGWVALGAPPLSHYLAFVVVGPEVAAAGRPEYSVCCHGGRFGRGTGGWMIKECQEVDFARKDIKDEEAGKLLWQFSEAQIEQKERESAVKRALANKEQQEKEKQKNNGASSSKPAAKEQTPGSRRSRKAK